MLLGEIGVCGKFNEGEGSIFIINSLKTGGGQSITFVTNKNSRGTKYNFRNDLFKGSNC